jgi:hypothetical protein
VWGGRERQDEGQVTLKGQLCSVRGVGGWVGVCGGGMHGRSED